MYNIVSTLKTVFTYGNTWQKIVAVILASIHIAGFSLMVYGSWCLGMYIATH